MSPNNTSVPETQILSNQNETEAVTEHRELDLSRVEDLDVFLESTYDVFAAAMEFKTVAQKNDYTNLEIDGLIGAEVFEAVQQKRDELSGLISEARDCVAAKAGELTDEGVEQMQHLYNQMVRLRDYIYRACMVESESPQEESLVEKSDGTVAVEEPAVCSSFNSTAPDSIGPRNQQIETGQGTGTVCGFALPVAGRAGIVAARALREGLMIARDSHSELKQHPEKQIIVDKLIRHLSVIPPEGLDAQTDIPLLYDLAKQVDVSSVETAPMSVEISVSDVLNEKKAQAESAKVIEIKKRQTMSIQADDCDGSIKIDVPIRKKLTKPNRTIQHGPLQPEPEAVVEKTNSQYKVIAATEEADVVNTVVPDTVPSVPTSRPSLAESSLTNIYLKKDKRYMSFINTHYTSPAAFERVLDTVITQIEARTIDPFERWLGERTISPFSFLQNLTVQEVLELAAHKEVRAVLQSEKVKYETFVTWVDLIDEMQMLVSEDLQITFGELFARWLVESEIQYESSTEAS